MQARPSRPQKGRERDRDLPESPEPRAHPTSSTTDKHCPRCHAGRTHLPTSAAGLTWPSLDKWVRSALRAGTGWDRQRLSLRPFGQRLLRDLHADACATVPCSAAPPRRECATGSFGALDKPPTAHPTITILQSHSTIITAYKAVNSYISAGNPDQGEAESLRAWFLNTASGD